MRTPPARSEEDDDEEFDGLAYKVARLNGSVGSGAKRKFIVQWQGSNFRGDTIEPEANVWPRSHISRLDGHLVTVAVTQQPLLDLRTAGAFALEGSGSAYPFGRSRCRFPSSTTSR